MSRRLAIPRAIRIRGKTWRVRYTGKRAPKRRTMRGVLGESNAATRTIWLDGTIPRREQEVTLVHEVLHALVGEDSLPGEEAVIERLEGPLHALLLSGVLVAVPEEAR